MQDVAARLGSLRDPFKLQKDRVSNPLRINRNVKVNAIALMDFEFSNEKYVRYFLNN